MPAFAPSIGLTASYNNSTVSQSVLITSASGTQAKPSTTTRLRSLSCEPDRSQSICLIDFTGPSDSKLSLSLSSSTASLKLPSAIVIQPGQSSARFRVDQVLPARGQATITAQLGTDSVETALSLDSRPAPPDVPGHIYARHGALIQFRISSPDPLGTVTVSNLPPGAFFDASTGFFQWVPGVVSDGSHKVVFTAADAAGGSSSASSIIDVDSGSPVLERVVNAASRSQAACSPGAIARLEGKWLVDGPDASDTTGQSTELSGTTVKVNGAFVPILSASTARVDFLCPEAVSGAVLDISLQTPAGLSRTIQTVSQDVAPGVFSLDESGSGQGFITHSGTAIIAMIPNHQFLSGAAFPAGVVTVYATGIRKAGDLSVMLGNTAITPQSVAATPDHAGLYQVSVRLPSGTAAGDMPLALNLKMQDGSVFVSNQVLIATESLQIQ